jgi:hypothetical protein
MLRGSAAVSRRARFVSHPLKESFAWWDPQAIRGVRSARPARGMIGIFK